MTSAGTSGSLNTDAMTLNSRDDVDCQFVNMIRRLTEEENDPLMHY